MSLIGSRSAVISLGASCQTAMQLHAHREMLSERLGDQLEPRSLPFDWMFAPAAAAARLLHGPLRVPERPGELVLSQRLFWPRQGIWLWHDPPEPEEFPAMQARMERRWARMESLRALDRRVFVMSNTQNNLDTLPERAPQALGFRLTAQRMQGLVTAVEAMFGPTGNSVVFVSYARRVSRDALETGLPLALIEPDETDHEGDPVQWGAALDRLVEPVR